MNAIIKAGAYLWAICLITSFLVAEEQSKIPSGAWEQHSEGVAVAMFLKTKMESGSEVGRLKVFIKNTSNIVKYLPNTAIERAIKIFYIDGTGKRVPLRDYTVSPQNVLAAAIPNLRPYQPGEIDKKTIELSVSELAIVKQNKVLCLFYISDQQNGGTPVEHLQFSRLDMLYGKGRMTRPDEMADGIIKQDKRGRMRVTRQRREELLAEFDRSAMTGRQFAAWAGIKHSTFAN